MRLSTEATEIKYSGGALTAEYSILAAHEIGGVVVVLYDYMSFPSDKPSRNLFAYDFSGVKLWRAQDIGLGATDGYTNIISETPLVVGNFAGYTCTIDIKTGSVIKVVFTK